MAAVTEYRSDTGPFVVVPVWVLELPISHLAFRLYALHADLADRDGTHFHSRKRLAERLGCSLDSLDRANDMLIRNAALSIRKRRDKAGDPTSNRYVVRRVRPAEVAAQMRLPSRVDAATGSRVDAARSNTKDLFLTNACVREDDAPAPTLTREAAQQRVRELRRRYTEPDSVNETKADSQ